MIDADKLVRAALVTVLRGDSALTALLEPSKIVDFVGASTPLPFANLGSDGQIQLLDSDQDLVAVTLNLEVWTDEQSRTLMWAIGAAAKTSILGGLLADPSHDKAIVAVALSSVRSTTSAARTALRLILPLRAIVQLPASAAAAAEELPS